MLFAGTPRPTRIFDVLLLLVLGVQLAGCATTGDRPFVITSATQVGDLYWRGELTDRVGNRWNVWLIPGIAPTFEAAAEAFGDSFDLVGELGEGETWDGLGEDVSDGFEFAFVDCVGDFLLEGIADDYADTTDDLGELASATPFGWIPRMLGTALLGYVLLPAGRLVLTPFGVVGGVAYGTLWPTAQVIARPIGAGLWIVVGGVAVPAVRLVAHQPVFLLSLVNREPALEHDGSFGLEIIHRVSPMPGEPGGVLAPQGPAKPIGPAELRRLFLLQLLAMEVEAIDAETQARAQRIYEEGTRRQQEVSARHGHLEAPAPGPLTPEARRIVASGELKARFLAAFRELKARYPDLGDRLGASEEQAWERFLEGSGIRERAAMPAQP